MKTMILLVVSALVVSVVATGQKMTSRVQRFSGNVPYVDPPNVRSGPISKWTERQHMMLNKLKRYRRMAEDVNFARSGMHDRAAPLKRFKRPVV
ncbi:hypothetical protein HOLleu_06544 [Holothuria leucospilota]|uniref:Uncharacterized protein n=1 Tax=Holothuria leucospilota TaxID=206669 RepID=A0A9Q1HI47_HOLLE|nr:hypothetical protein HOLleu_06544 [Holothuria leucospilota]